VEEFSSLLLQTGNGNLAEQEGKVALTLVKALTKSLRCNVVHDLAKLAERIYPDLVNLNSKDIAWLKERTILSPKKETGYNINNTILDKLPTECVRYQSVDSVVEIKKTVLYSVEFLHSLNPPGIPPHNLFLKL